jgi:3-deoxy-7-phosphoheptulonate synthase
MSQKNTIRIIDELELKPFVIAGPCSVESEEQITRIAGELSIQGIRFLRGGAHKPRTSPKTFQGLGDQGYEYLRRAADKYGMFSVSEVMDERQLDKSFDLVDMFQIGSRNMASYSFLKAIGKKTSTDNKPVLLKRGFSSTLQELIFAADYIIDQGNPNVILCLRGIRTFEQIESEMRFTPDLGAILELKERTNLRIVFDPSHSTGNKKYVVQVAKTALFMGADGLMIETHDRPEEAMSDPKQCILPDMLSEIMEYAKTLHLK